MKHTDKRGNMKIWQTQYKFYVHILEVVVRGVLSLHVHVSESQAIYSMKALFHVDIDSISQ